MYNIIAIKRGESTHFLGRTGNRGETTRISEYAIQNKTQALRIGSFQPQPQLMLLNVDGLVHEQFIGND